MKDTKEYPGDAYYCAVQKIVDRIIKDENVDTDAEGYDELLDQIWDRAEQEYAPEHAKLVEAIDFLKSKGLIEEGHNDFIVRYVDGRPQVSLPALLVEYFQYARDKQRDRILAKTGGILATEEDIDIFIKSVESPPEPGEGLKKAQEAYLKSGIIDMTN